MDNRVSDIAGRIARVTANTVEEAAQSYGHVLKYVHIVVTALFIIWGLLISWKVTHAPTDNRRQAWQYVNQTWTGTNTAGIFWNLLTLWTCTILLSALYPVMAKLGTKLQAII